MATNDVIIKSSRDGE